MSIKSWKQEFYPTTAKSQAAKKDPVGHSILKWTGLLKENLFRHNLTKNNVWDTDNVYDADGEYIEIDTETCALCVKFYERGLDGKHDKEERCLLCPLYQSLGRRCDDGDKSPYIFWRKTGNATPMLRALEKLKKPKQVTLTVSRGAAEYWLDEARDELEYWENTTEINDDEETIDEMVDSWRETIEELEKALGE